MLAETAAGAREAGATADEAAVVRAFGEWVRFRVASRAFSFEAEDGADEGPEVGQVGDDDGGGGFAGVPVEIDQGPEGGVEVGDAVEDGAEDLVWSNVLGHDSLRLKPSRGFGENLLRSR